MEHKILHIKKEPKVTRCYFNNTGREIKRKEMTLQSIKTSPNSSSIIKKSKPIRKNQRLFIQFSHSKNPVKATSEQISKIKIDKVQSNQIGNICAICQEEFIDKDNIITLPVCNHIFHSDCLLIWYHMNEKCPVCKQRN